MVLYSQKGAIGENLTKWAALPLAKGTSRDLRRALFDDLLRKFQKCHDLIWEGGKLDPASAFDEFSKLLMAKIYDERFTPFNEEYCFQAKTNEKADAVVDRIRKRYEQVKEKNADVFRSEIKLSDDVIVEIVKILQEVSLKLTDLDIKGRAFELFLGKIFRDEYGQYFTPRNIVKFMVDLVDPDENDVIIDPACGSGGFLLYSLMNVTNKVLERYKDDKDTINRVTWDFAHKQMFGIEINDRIARISIMDMVIHEDGHSNIECNNALSDYDQFDKRRDIRANKYSILLTNPPFGAIVRDKNILRKFKLGRDRGSQKTEILFIERCLDLIEPTGKVGIVLPDSILTNSSLQYVRDYILENARITAIVSLPHHTFIPSGANVKSSLLFLEKTSNNVAKKGSRKIFMAVAKHIGYDSRGMPDSNDLIKILDDWKEYIRNGTSFKKSFVVNEDEMTKGFSPEQFVFYSNNREWEKKKLSDLCDGKVFTGRSPPRNSYADKGPKILKVRDLTGKGIDWDKEERAFVFRDFYVKNTNIRLQENDVVFISGAHHPKYIGQKIDIIDAIPERFDDGVIASAQLMVLRVNSKKVDPYYVLLFLKTKDGYRAIQSCIRGQTAHIYPKDIRNIEIPIPPEPKMGKMRNDIENVKKFLKEKEASNEKYIQSLGNVMNILNEQG